MRESWQSSLARLGGGSALRVSGVKPDACLIEWQVLGQVQQLLPSAAAGQSLKRQE